MRRFCILLFCAGVLVQAASPALERARKLYSYTEYEESLRILLPMQPKDGDVLELIGRNYYMSGDYKKATEYLDKAAAAEPSSSNHFLWLARAYGRRAETSSPLTAPGHASKARQNFEKSVQLDPNNLEAISDLFEYYLEAPGFLGGGYNKAATMADRINQIDPIEGYWAKAKLAEKRKEYGNAEEQLRRAAELAPHQVGRLIELARFFAKQGRFQESEESFNTAEKLAPNNAGLLFARADTYIRNKRNLDTARELLKRYLNARLTPDDPPRSEAQKLLKQVSGT